MIKKLLMVVLAVVILVVIVTLIKRKKVEEAALARPKIYPVIVKTIKPRMDTFRLTLTSLGVVESQSNVVISTKIPSRILYLKPLGSAVKKGEIVAKLDSSSTQSKIESVKSSLVSLKSRLKSAELSLKNMLLTHERTKKLMAVGGASIEQYQKETDAIASIRSNIEGIKSQMSSLRSTLKELKVLLGYTIIKSPVDGVVSARFANVGDVAAPGRPLMKIAATGSKYLLIRVPESVKPEGIIFKGEMYPVTRLNSTFNGLDEYKADVKTNLSAGSRVEIGVVIFNGRGVKLPPDAILNDNGKSYVLVVKKDRAFKRPIKIVTAGEEGVAVDGNIAGESVVVAKPDILIKLTSGVRVIVKE